MRNFLSMGESRVEYRKSLKKFGDALVCCNDVTTVSNTEVYIEKDLGSVAMNNEQQISTRRYVPPGKRGSLPRPLPVNNDGQCRVNDHRQQPIFNSKSGHPVRVNNILLEAQEIDLRELFATFGPIARLSIASDWGNRFGLVDFVHREDAMRAVNKLKGYGYNNVELIS